MNDDDQLSCSFCGRAQHEVTRLVSGRPPDSDDPVVHICNGCVDLAHQIIHSPSPGPASEPTWTPFVYKGSEFEWCAFPRVGGDGTLLYIREYGGGRSTGALLTADETPSTEEAVLALDDLFDTLS